MKILGFTGSRADYYLQRSVFAHLKGALNVDLEIIVSGGILEESTSRTLADIENDNIPILAKLKVDPAVLASDSHSLQIANLLPALDSLIVSSKADVAVVYADRFESFAFALAAFHRNLIILHLEAGDVTEGGTYDDSIRHCITKLSHLQATSTKQGLRVVRSLGEESWRSEHVGLLSYESMASYTLEESRQVAHSLGLRPEKGLILATMHPIPSAPDLTYQEASAFFSALVQVASLDLFDIVITSPNSDQGSSAIAEIISHAVSTTPQLTYIESLGGFRYHALLSLASTKTVIVAGNSSSVIKEAPFYGAHGLNIGRRQLGREKADSQLDVIADTESIVSSLLRLADKKCLVGRNPYFSESPSLKVVEFLIASLQANDRNTLLMKRWNHG